MPRREQNSYNCLPNTRIARDITPRNHWLTARFFLRHVQPLATAKQVALLSFAALFDRGERSRLRDSQRSLGTVAIRVRCAAARVDVGIGSEAGYRTASQDHFNLFSNARIRR
jgi:hypothetical protein